MLFKTVRHSSQHKALPASLCKTKRQRPNSIHRACAGIGSARYLSPRTLISQTSNTLSPSLYEAQVWISKALHSLHSRTGRTLLCCLDNTITVHTRKAICRVQKLINSVLRDGPRKPGLSTLASYVQAILLTSRQPIALQGLVLLVTRYRSACPPGKTCHQANSTGAQIMRAPQATANTPEAASASLKAQTPPAYPVLIGMANMLM